MELDPRGESRCGYSDYYSTGGSYRPPRQPKNYGALAAVVGLLLLCVAGGMALTRGNEESSAQESGMAETVSAAVAEPAASATPPARTELVSTGEPGDFRLELSGERTETMALTDVYKKLIPSVASITAASGGGKSTGTGIVMSADGYILTNYHVISGAGAVTVLLSSEEEYAAVEIGSDETSDLAVLKIDAQGLTPAEFCASDTVEVGDAVVAIGDPLGTELRGTMTDGIICGINRDVKVGDRTMTLIQTNAALNSGNSGGPLVNMAGQVIGINTMKLRSYYNSVEGIGFAIPSSAAGPIIDELLEKGYVSGRPAFGFSVEELSAQLRLFYNLPGYLCIRSVMEDSDAARKGLAAGDIIVAVDGESVNSLDEFNTVKNRFAAGDTVTLTVFRKGEQMDVDVVLMDRADLD